MAKMAKMANVASLFMAPVEILPKVDCKNDDDTPSPSPSFFSMITRIYRQIVASLRILSMVTCTLTTTLTLSSLATKGITSREIK
jgi:hypothetical protein